jgi:hypothetical protein
VDWSSRKQTSVCKPNCKPTAQHSMALDITDQDHRTRNAELGHTLSYWTTQQHENHRTRKPLYGCPESGGMWLNIAGRALLKVVK